MNHSHSSSCANGKCFHNTIHKHVTASDIVQIIRNEFSVTIRYAKEPVRLGNLKDLVEDKYSLKLQYEDVKKAVEAVYNDNVKISRKPFSNGKYLEFEYFLKPDEVKIPSEGFISEVKSFLFKLPAANIIAYDKDNRTEPYFFNSTDKLFARKEYRKKVKGLKHEDVRMVKVETYLKNNKLVAA